MELKKSSIVISILALALLFFFGCFQSQPENPVLGDTHIHVDFKVYLNDVAYDFSREKFMSDENNVLSNFVHLHDGGGDVIHVHIAGVTIGEFFDSLGMDFNSTCIMLDDENTFCSAQNKNLKMYVNGNQNFDFKNYEFKDLDKILVSFGSEDKKIIMQQLDSITDKACIQSGKCPHRGAPIEESSCLTVAGCVAGE